MPREPFDHDLPEPRQSPAEDCRALSLHNAKVRLSMAKWCRLAGDEEGVRVCVAAARFWRRAAHDEGALILKGRLAS